MSSKYLEIENFELRRQIRTKEMNWEKEKALLSQKISQLQEKIGDLSQKEKQYKTNQSSLTNLIKNMKVGTNTCSVVDSSKQGSPKMNLNQQKKPLFFKHERNASANLNKTDELQGSKRRSSNGRNLRSVLGSVKDEDDPNYLDETRTVGGKYKDEDVVGKFSKSYSQ